MFALAYDWEMRLVGETVLVAIPHSVLFPTARGFVKELMVKE
jgi:hypothetical protein